MVLELRVSSLRLWSLGLRDLSFFPSKARVEDPPADCDTPSVHS